VEKPSSDVIMSIATLQQCNVANFLHMFWKLSYV